MSLLVLHTKPHRFIRGLGGRVADEDGDLDLRLWFRVRDTGIACGDDSAELSGQTYEGTDISATDGLFVVSCQE